MDLKTIRAEKDAFFAHHPQSPLTREQKKVFSTLEYFPETPELRLEVAVEQFPEMQSVQFQTSTGDIQTYQRYGKFRFKVDEQEAELTIYVDAHSFFLPFVDSLAGTQTYPAGRYLEPTLLPDGKFLVDFNLAYNPYCAYNDSWSCPLTPPENRLRVPVRAGEKIFAHENKQELI